MRKFCATCQKKVPKRYIEAHKKFHRVKEQLLAFKRSWGLNKDGGARLEPGQGAVRTAVVGKS